MAHAQVPGTFRRAGRRWTGAASLSRLLGVGIVLAGAAAAGQSRPSYRVERGQLVLPSRIAFAGSGDTLLPESTAALEHVRGFLTDRQDVTLARIEGHTDAQGGAAANQALSERRALAVARWLVAHGVACKRLIPAGFGESKPIADNRTREGRDQNRRMVVVVAALRGHLIGGLPADGGGRVAGDPCR